MRLSTLYGKSDQQGSPQIFSNSSFFIWDQCYLGEGLAAEQSKVGLDPLHRQWWADQPCPSLFDFRLLRDLAAVVTHQGCSCFPTAQIKRSAEHACSHLPKTNKTAQRQERGLSRVKDRAPSLNALCRQRLHLSAGPGLREMRLSQVSLPSVWPPAPAQRQIIFQGRAFLPCAVKSKETKNFFAM